MGARGKEELFNGYRVSICENEKVLEMDGGGGCSTMWMYTMPQSIQLKRLKCKFYVIYILLQKSQMIKGYLYLYLRLFIRFLCAHILSSHHRISPFSYKWTGTTRKPVLKLSS